MNLVETLQAKKKKGVINSNKRLPSQFYENLYCVECLLVQSQHTILLENLQWGQPDMEYFRKLCELRNPVKIILHKYLDFQHFGQNNLRDFCQIIKTRSSHKDSGTMNV